MKYAIHLLLALLSLSLTVSGQEMPLVSEKPSEKVIKNSAEMWTGFYTKYRLTDRLFYYGEYHICRKEFLKEMGQIYLRFGASYIVNKNFEITGGIVTPFYWAPNPENPNIDKVVPQFRFWQQFLFIIPFDRLKIYHQIRTEQR